MKPSFGRIPFAILPNVFDPLAHHGPITRTVADAAAFLSVTAGPDDRDPYSLPFDKNQGVISDIDFPRLKIAFSVDQGFQSVDQDVAANAENMVDQLINLGASVEAVDLGFDDDISMAMQRLACGLFFKYYGMYEMDNRDRLDPTLLHFIELGRKLSVNDLLEVDMVRTKHWRRLVEIFSHYDAIICPTMPRTAPGVGKTELDYSGKDRNGASIRFDMTSLFNLFGQLPVITIPSGLGADNLPTGIQIVGRRFDESTILGIANALHDEILWTDRLRNLTWNALGNPKKEGVRA